MKCGAWIIKYTSGEKKGKLYKSLHSGFGQVLVAQIIVEHNKRSKNKVAFVDFCDGDMSIQTDVVEVPCFGGSYPELQIEHICSKCGKIYHPKLPMNQSELESLFNNYIDHMES